MLAPDVVASLVLCAGLGTRLLPLSSWRAKPLVPVGDRPALAHVVDRVRAVSRVVVVNAHYRAEDVATFARGAGLVVSREAELLGTAGGIAHAAEALGAGDVLVWNGDMLGDLDAATLLVAHARAAEGGALATLAVAPRGNGARVGNVGLDAGGRVVRLRAETTAPGEASGADFLGIYVVGAELRRAFPRVGGLVEDVLLPAMHRGARVATFACGARFVDIGTPAAYLEANLAWLAARGEGAWRGEGAHVDAGVALDQAVLGAGARVVGAGPVERCVVWPGAEVHAPIAGAIVAPEGIVRVD